MSNLLREVRDKRKKIEELQRQKAKQEGQKEQILKRLKGEFGINFVEDIEKELEKLGKELVANEETLKQHLDEMENIISGVHSKDTTRASEEK